MGGGIPVSGPDLDASRFLEKLISHYHRIEEGFPGRKNTADEQVLPGTRPVKIIYSPTMTPAASSGYTLWKEADMDITTAASFSTTYTVQVDKYVIAKAAREQIQESLIGIFLRQAWTEFQLSVFKRVNFRKNQNEDAVRAYSAMSISEFEGINARQRWANWRTIPRNLNGQLNNTPCRAIDLCSGIGDSAQVLAYYLPAGSEILGLEFSPQFVKIASERTYRHRSGVLTKARFRAQSILQTFHDERGEPIGDRSVMLVNSCGALGMHFNLSSISKLIEEIARVLKRGGLAMIDSGSPGVNERDLTRLFRANRCDILSSAKSCIFDRYAQICFCKT